MKKTFVFTILIVVSSVLLTGCRPDEDSVKLTKTELNNFLGADGSQQTAVTDANLKFGGIAAEAASKGVSATDAELITKALADSFKMKADEVEITVEKESTHDFATGYVNVGEGDKGGIYFAARVGDNWEIAHNGTGIITCEQIADYDFPTGLIPRCFDQATGQNVDR